MIAQPSQWRGGGDAAPLARWQHVSSRWAARGQRPLAAPRAFTAEPQRSAAARGADTPHSAEQRGTQGATGPPPAPVPRERAVLLQAFAWDSWRKGGGNWYGKVQQEIPLMKAAGVTHVWLPPPSSSVSKEGYLPGQLYCMTSAYGKRQQLVDLTSALRAEGLVPVADIVINHRCADVQEGGVYNTYRDVVDHPGHRVDWGKWAITRDDPRFGGTGNPDTGADYAAAPDLDHTNPQLRAALKDWLSWLHNDMGFQGWRFDYVPGYGPQYVREYVDASLGPNAFCVGEYWADMAWSGSQLQYNQDAARQKLCDWIDGTGKRCCAFDFPTKALLQEAVKNTQYDRLRDGQGKAPGLLGWWPGRAVTFVDNHDTGSTQQHWPFPSSNLGIGYAYIFTHPGIPCIFWDHLCHSGAELRRTILGLSALRKRAGIVSESKLEILAAERDMYVARIGGRLVIKMGPRLDMGSLLPRREEGWAFAMSGRDWAVWERTGG